jgi:hypothetical protein
MSCHDLGMCRRLTERYRLKSNLEYMEEFGRVADQRRRPKAQARPDRSFADHELAFLVCPGGSGSVYPTGQNFGGP